MIAGIAGGLSTRFGIDVTIVRIVLVLAALASGFGVTAYVIAWLLVPFDGEEQNIASRALSDHRGMALALAFVPPLALFLVVSSALGAPYLSTLTWATFTSAAGVTLVYRNADEGERATMRRAATPFIELGSGVRPRRMFALRLAAGLVLLTVGLVFLVLGHSSLAALRPIGGAVLVVAAIVVLFGPWWLHLARDLVSERQARARAEERADMAARVHDSVLQTLALIQRSANDPKHVAQLARAQERELRSWLFDGNAPGPFAEDAAGDVATAVEQIAREVEGLHPIAVDNVTVGDCPLDPDLSALLAAAREAVLNAAKWSGASVVSIYSEVEPKSVSIFVRDRGSGFDRSAVAGDRRGITDSIERRVARHGGTAVVHTEQGQGTEVELVMPRRARRA
jgi:signal transduction histidine kinase